MSEFLKDVWRVIWCKYQIRKIKKELAELEDMKRELSRWETIELDDLASCLIADERLKERIRKWQKS